MEGHPDHHTLWVLSSPSFGEQLVEAVCKLGADVHVHGVVDLSQVKSPVSEPKLEEAPGVLDSCCANRRACTTNGKPGWKVPQNCLH